MYVADAVGGRSQIAHRTAIERLAQAVVTELFRDWGTPLVGRARDVIYGTSTKSRSTPTR